MMVVDYVPSTQCFGLADLCCCIQEEWRWLGSEHPSLDSDTEYDPFVEEPSDCVKREIYMEKLQQAFLNAGDTIEVSSGEDGQPPTPPRAKRYRKGKKSTGAGGHGKVKRKRKRTHSMVQVQKDEEPKKLPTTRPECEEAQSKPSDGQRLKATGFSYPVCLCKEDESCEEDCPCKLLHEHALIYTAAS